MGGGGVQWGGQVENSKKKIWGVSERGGGVGLGGVRVDVNEELKFL